MRRAAPAPAFFLRLFACAALAALLAVPPARAGAEGEVSRRVLGIYNGMDEERGDPLATSIHTFLEKPLNHLGLTVDYADVNRPLPDFSPYAGIVVWISSYRIEQPERFLPWLLEAMDAGVKVVLPAGIQAPENTDGEPVDAGLVAEVLNRFGLRALPASLGEKADPLRVHDPRPEFFSHETTAFSGQLTYPVYRTARPGVDVWRRIERAADPEEHTIGVVVGQAGGWAMTSTLLYFAVGVPGTAYRVAWNINPIDFLEHALDCSEPPRPDVTTFWGARGAFSHVDVDGAYNMSQPDVPGPSRFALEVCLEEIWEKCPYPTTLGLIACEYDPGIDPRFIHDGDTIEETLVRPPMAWERPQREVAAELRRILGKIAPLPWIQYGCHGYAHPLFWRELTPSYAIRGYKVSYESETRDAVEYLDRHVLPPGKKVELFQWTGDCDPPEEPLDILDGMGIAHINGGDPLYDARQDSLYYVCPLSVPKGGHRQIYTAGSNENIYSEGWTGYKGAYNHVVATFERSESPIRLLPVNIYYHVFPAERLAGYLAIRNAYDWAAKQELCWITAAEYVRAAEAFFPVRIGRLAGGGWWVEDYGVCPTVRFDDEKRAVDM
ncbi:MAG: hypothetical protein LBS30_05115, partial [Planctomycetota bacterium]|nr:hypothetical protein [Planctomycetota bacterium]